MRRVRSRISRQALVALAAMLVTGAALGCSGNRQAAGVQPAPRNPDVMERADIPTYASDLADVLQGHFAGLLVQRSNGSVSVQIRGVGSGIVSDALIMVDGVEAPPQALLQIRPMDVQRIEVLKGAAAGLYGMRGANGVVVITTRRGT